jgi:hypothetical protein
VNDGSDTVLLLVPTAIAALSIWGCYALAQRKGYSIGWAIAFGILFGLIALIVYALLPHKAQPTFPTGGGYTPPPPDPSTPPPLPPPPSSDP